MKKGKFLFLGILILITCTGCSVEYNINITQNNIEEVINVADYVIPIRNNETILRHYNTWYPTFVNYINDGETIELENFSNKVDGIEYHSKTIKEIDNGYNYTYKYTYSIDEYYDSYLLASTFPEVTIQENDNNLVISTSKENFLCNYSYFDTAKVNITIDPQVYELNYTNTNEINNNTYTWNLNQNNCTNSQIILTLSSKSNINDDFSTDSLNGNNDNTNNDVSNDQNNYNDIKDNNYNKYTMYIFAVAAIVIILIGYYIFKKIKEKSENNNSIDD